MRIELWPKMEPSKNGRHLTSDNRTERTTDSMARVVKRRGGPEDQQLVRACRDKLLI